MVSNSIWMDSGAMVSMIPEMDLYLGDFASSSSSNNETVITLGASFTGKFSLVANLYRGCYLNIYVGTAHTGSPSGASLTENQHIDRVMIISNAVNTITVNDSLPADFASDETKFYGIIEHFGTPIPAPSAAVTGSLSSATITTAGDTILASSAILDNTEINAVSGISGGSGGEIELTLSAHATQMTFATVAADNYENGAGNADGFITLYIAGRDGTERVAVLFNDDSHSAPSTSADRDITITVTTGDDGNTVAEAVRLALAGEDLTITRAANVLTITNSIGGFVTNSAEDTNGGVTVDSNTAGGAITAVTINTAGTSFSGSGSATISSSGTDGVIAITTSTAGNPKLLSDTWLGLTDSVSIPSTSIETKGIPISTGSRSMVYQFKGMETTSGGSFSVTANNFSWLYYAFGNKEISAIDSPVGAVSVSDEFTTSGFSTNDTNFVYDTDAPTIGFNRVETNTICPPLNPLVSQNTANVKKVNTGDLTKKITYTFTESNSEDLPTFALEYTLKKPDDQLTVAVDAGSQILPSGMDASKETVYTKIYPGCMVSSLTLDASANQEVKMNVNFETKKTFVAPTNYDTANGETDVKDFVNFGSPQGGDANIDEELLRPFFFSDGTISMFGQDYIRIETMSLEINNSLTPKRFVGRYDKTSQFHFPGQRTYNLSFSGLVTDSAVFDALRETQAFSLSGTTGNELTLRFTKDLSTDEILEMKFEDYMVTTAEFPLTNDKGPITVNWTIVPLRLKSCTHDTSWIIQG
jgi:hypothetical protein